MYKMYISEVYLECICIFNGVFVFQVMSKTMVFVLAVMNNINDIVRTKITGHYLLLGIQTLYLRHI